MGRTAFVVSTMVLSVTFGCGGRESGTGAGTSGGSDASGSGTITRNSSGTSGGSAVAGTGRVTGSGSRAGTSWSSLPLCGVTAFQSTLVWATVCYPAAASPEGTACSEATTACGFCSFFECGGVPDQSHSPRQFYSCSCVNGRQQCSLVDQDAGVCALAEAGMSTRDAEIPVYHRAAPATCPPKRGPGTSGVVVNGMPGFPACPMPPSPTTVCCSSDSDCDAGTNGRCTGSNSGPLPSGNQCTYDECFIDSNCPSGTPCICRSSPTDNTANVCVTGGNCVVDSDCGSGSYCSPSPLLNSCDDPGPYYCHTAADTCVDDSDCFVDGGASFFCAYDPKARHWGCSEWFCPP